MSTTQSSLKNYEILEKIYEGDKTLVYRGRRKYDNQNVVIKLIKNSYPTLTELIKFRHQYTLLSLLNDPSIIKSYGLESHQNGLALILEDFGGISLREYLNAQTSQDSLRTVDTANLIPLSTFFKVALQLTQALESLYHSKIIHKDIKPQNILIHPATHEVKLADFSIASRSIRESQGFQSPELLEGTMAYMSPEQTGRMNRSIDHRTDFYSLGVTFYELLTGSLPFRSSELLQLVHEHIARAPIEPLQVNPKLPHALNQIILKLLAKIPEDRYQTAFGLKHDLECCQANWINGINRIFNLGAQDISDRLIIPEKLYGREKELETLTAAFERVAQGQAEIIMVTGSSGVGKTSFVKEIQKLVVQRQGYFISGKFEQFHSKRPLEAIINAFKDLIFQLLTEGKPKIQNWQTRITEALGKNSQVLTEVLPELEFLIGKQTQIPVLEAIPSQNRFNFTFQQFIQIFPQNKYPLVLFLDDLQWADLASLQLIQSLMSHVANSHLLIIGAYRHNEVDASHPLQLSIDEIQKNNATLQNIHLKPLSVDAWNNLLLETLKSPYHIIEPLAQWIYKKTQGNPFFCIQYLKNLYQDNFITFNGSQRIWQWSLANIESNLFADNIVEFITIQIQKLSPDTQNLLQIAACIGASFSSTVLAHISKYSHSEVCTHLWEALQVGLIISENASYDLDRGNLLPLIQQSPSPSIDIQLNSNECIYSFVHDRVQQALYSLVSIEQKNNFHLKIGRYLLETLSSSEQDEKICEIVNQLNLGSVGIENSLEGSYLAQLNRLAGCKAQTATAYTESANYFATGIKLLQLDGWHTNYELMLRLHYGLVESILLLGDYVQTEILANEIITHGKTLLDQIKAYQVKIESCKAQGQSLKSVTLGLEVLEKFGIKFPVFISPEDVKTQIHITELNLIDKKFENLLELSTMVDPDSLIIMDLIGRLLPITYSCDSLLFSLLLLKLINLSVSKGNSSISSWAYIAYGVILWSLDREINEIYKFGQLGIRLSYNFNEKNNLVVAVFTFNTFIFYWKNHLKETLSPLLNNYIMSLEVGDLVHASFSLAGYLENSFWCGKSLLDLEKEFSRYYKGMLKLKQEIPISFYEVNWQATLSLTIDVSSKVLECNDLLQDEQAILRRLENTENRQAIFLFYLNKLHNFYLFRDFSEAIKYLRLSKIYSDSVPCRIVFVSFCFYKILTLLATYGEENEAEQYCILEAIENQIEVFRKWADSAPMNFLHKYCLVKAEHYRVLGQQIEAMAAYDEAIALAQENEYLNEEALAYELAGIFYLSWDKKRIAQTYLVNAYYAYERWGAKAKLRDLEERYPNLLNFFRQSESNLQSTTLTTFSDKTSFSNKTNILDWVSVMKASQALSQEIDLDRLLTTIMQVVIENAGAEHGSLLLIEEESLTLKAHCTLNNCYTNQYQIVNDDAQWHQNLPMSVLNYAEHTHQALVLANAFADNRFAMDPYMEKHQPRSILCMPIQRQGQLIGLLYLENNLTTNAFTTDRLEILQLLTAQAAISLENAQLYASVEQKVKDRTLELQIAKQEAEQAKEASEKANLAKSEFLASMSHELRTPLNAVLGFSQLLHRDPTASPEQKQKLGIINRSGEHLLTLINDVLTMSKIESGRTTLNEKDFDIQAMLLSLHEMLLLKANSKKLNFKFECAPEVPQFIRTDEGKLRQVLVNLLGNAIKFTQQGYINLRVNAYFPEQISVEQNSSVGKAIFLNFEVEDTGPGIASHELKDLFETFAQTETGRQSQEGTGLGLPISRKFIQLMGGDIKVNSILGKGTCFDFNIQVVQSEEMSLACQKLDSVIRLEANQLNYRILVVEDRLENQEVLVELLEAVGFDVQVASNGKEAIALWQTYLPHLILMDLQMPIMDGYEALLNIKSQSAESQLPLPIVIAVTANTFEDTRLKTVEMGFNDFIHKPFQVETLLETIGNHLEVRYLRQGSSSGSAMDLRAEPIHCPDTLQAEDFQALSSQWRHQVFLAASALDESSLLELIDQVSEEYPRVSRTFMALLKKFRFDQIVRLIEPSLGR